jgi:acyl carrier protein
MDNKDKLLAFLKKYFKLEKVTDDTNIFKMGFVNSLFSMQLVMFLEEAFDITIDTMDMDFDNFSTINSILSFIERKRG